MAAADTSLPTSPPPRAAEFALRGLEVRYPGSGRAVLAGVDLDLGAGEIACLRGRSGSGKSTLLKVVNGLVPWLEPAAVGGQLHLDGASLDDLDPGQRAPLLGSCLDRPDAQLFLATPRHELAAAARLHGAPAPDELVERLGLGPLLDRRTTTLSSGERQRVALAVALTAAPRPLLLDEPTAHLDPAGAAALVGVLESASRLGASALIADHAGWRLEQAVSRWLRLRSARVAPAGPPRAPQLPPPRHVPGETVVLTAHGLVLERGGRRIAGPLDLELREGEVVVLSGPNGAGKSTLARALAGGHQRRVRQESRLGLMLPDATLQLAGLSVLDELERLGGDREAIARVLRRHRLETLAARAPWTLSRGERQRLVHAANDLTRPAVLIVDEPAQGLDPEDLADFVELVHRRAAKGRAYLLISHREEMRAVAHRRLHLQGGRLEEVAP